MILISTFILWHIFLAGGDFGLTEGASFQFRTLPSVCAYTTIFSTFKNPRRTCQLIYETKATKERFLTWFFIIKYYCKKRLTQIWLWHWLVSLKPPLNFVLNLSMSIQSMSIIPFWFCINRKKLSFNLHQQCIHQKLWLSCLNLQGFQLSGSESSETCCCFWRTNCIANNNT